MVRTPVEVPPELMKKLRARCDEGQLVELAASAAWDKYRARFNRVFGVRPAGAFCALPER